MDPLLLAGLLGAFGGLVRAAVGLFKALSIKMRIYWGYFFIAMIIASII